MDLVSAITRFAEITVNETTIPRVPHYFLFLACFSMPVLIGLIGQKVGEVNENER